tara:strand:+ start:356 stop:1057 length:702 start_codon:yes stop_codon:yes gene_type:complete
LKRENPNTGKPFRHGDVREDGYIFWAYELKLREDGTFYEKWRSPEVFKRLKEKEALRERKSNKGKRPTNPLTKKLYKRGDINEEGLFFLATDDYAPLDEEGQSRPIFVTEREFERKKQLRITRTIKKFKYFNYFIKRRFKLAQGRAKRKKLKFSITEDYLKSIYPSDGLCPVFGVKMEALGDRLNSASLDRIDNDKGYEEGNVRWICMRANRVKGTATDEEILALADFIRSEK